MVEWMVGRWAGERAGRWAGERAGRWDLPVRSGFHLSMLIVVVVLPAGDEGAQGP